jgi:hypothetical protein
MIRDFPALNAVNYKRCSRVKDMMSATLTASLGQNQKKQLQIFKAALAYPATDAPA